MLCVSEARTKKEIREQAIRLPFRGGCWHDGAASGVFACSLHDPRANSWNNVGFRAALPWARLPVPTGAGTVQGIKGPVSSPDGGKMNGYDAASRVMPNAAQHIKGDRLQSCLFAVGPGSMRPRRACSPALCMTRARTPGTLLGSAPLFAKCESVNQNLCCGAVAPLHPSGAMPRRGRAKF